MAQIEIRNLTFSYAGSENAAVRDVSLKINKGDFVVISGESGCGKTTLLRCLKPAIRPFGECDGNIFFEEKPVSEIDDRVQAGEVGFIMQNPEHQIVTDKVWHELAFGLENLGYKTEEIRVRVAEMAEYFGISEWYFESVDNLSGGQKQLLNLAAVMAMHPKVMVLDEPTAQLNPIAAENFIDTLVKINEDLGITIILSEHRLNYVLPKADKVVLMKEGEVFIEGTPKDVAGKVMDRELVKMMPIPVQLYKKYNSGKIDHEFHDSKYVEGELSAKNFPISVGEGRRWFESLNIEGKVVCENTLTSKDIAIECKNIWFRYERSGRDIVKGLNMSVMKGEIFAIMGGNGTGKTTTLSLLSKINKAYRGRMNIQGKVSLLPQNVQTLFSKMTVGEELKNVPAEIIKEMNLEKLMKKHPYDISGGQQQKLAMAKVLAANPDILLLDEPTKGIDAIYKEQLGEILKNLKQQGKTIILVSHDIDFCGQYADRCGLFAQGSLIAVNNFRDFFANNRFYTTTVNKMVGGKLINAVKMEDVV